MRGLGFKQGGCREVWVLGIVLEGDRTFFRKGDRLYVIIALAEPTMYQPRNFND
jgi:hypothetical protein